MNKAIKHLLRVAYRRQKIILKQVVLMTNLFQVIKFWIQNRFRIRSNGIRASTRSTGYKTTPKSQISIQHVPFDDEIDTYWYVQPELVSPARDSLSGLSNE